jgi:hypothetical protein
LPLAWVGFFAPQFVLHGWPNLFNTRRGIINNKSESGIMAESYFPELSSPF